jgi:hypothetical protein
MRVRAISVAVLQVACMLLFAMRKLLLKVAFPKRFDSKVVV